MFNRNDSHKLTIALGALVIGGAVFAQSPALTSPNNSAGSPLEAPATLQMAPPDTASTVQPPMGIPRMPQFTAPATTGAGMPTETENSLSAFAKLDPSHRGYVTRADTDRLSLAIPFDEADRNHDGRLSLDEFQRAWGDAGMTGQ